MLRHCTHNGRTLTRGELESVTNRLARAYAELGVRQGDYVTIALPNSIEWVTAVVATWKLGAIPQPLSSRLPDAEYGHLLDLRERALLVGRPDPRGRGPLSARRFRARARYLGRPSARGGFTGAEVDGIRRQHRPAEADRGRRATAGSPGTRWRR